MHMIVGRPGVYQLRQELLNVQNVPPVVYNNMIKAVGVCGDLEAAFDIVDQVFDRHKCLDQNTVRHLMMACISGMLSFDFLKTFFPFIFNRQKTYLLEYLILRCPV